MEHGLPRDNRLEHLVFQYHVHTSCIQSPERAQSNFELRWLNMFEVWQIFIYI